jgi:hypothetical protein
MSSTRISYHINAPCGRVYRALLDARAIAQRKVPDAMSCSARGRAQRSGEPTTPAAASESELYS